MKSSLLNQGQGQLLSPEAHFSCKTSLKRVTKSPLWSEVLSRSEPNFLRKRLKKKISKWRIEPEDQDTVLRLWLRRPDKDLRCVKCQLTPPDGAKVMHPKYPDMKKKTKFWSCKFLLPQVVRVVKAGLGLLCHPGHLKVSSFLSQSLELTFLSLNQIFVMS